MYEKGRFGSVPENHLRRCSLSEQRKCKTVIGLSLLNRKYLLGNRVYLYLIRIIFEKKEGFQAFSACGCFFCRRKSAWQFYT